MMSSDGGVEKGGKLGFSIIWLHLCNQMSLLQSHPFYLPVILCCYFNVCVIVPFLWLCPFCMWSWVWKNV